MGKELVCGWRVRQATVFRSAPGSLTHLGRNQLCSTVVLDFLPFRHPPAHSLSPPKHSELLEESWP